jgi:FkbM family methyltransferase
MSSEFQRWLNEKGDQTHRLNYNLNEQSIVFDVGGFRGEWANQIFQKYSCNIYIFEPVKSFYKTINNRFNNEKIRVYNFGLSNKNEECEISLSEDSSSVFKTCEKSEKIELINIEKFIKENKIESVDLIKINIEGGEYDLLESMIDSGLLSVFKNIQIQFHEFVPNSKKRRNNIREHLKNTHDLTYDFEFIWESWIKKTI